MTRHLSDNPIVSNAQGVQGASDAPPTPCTPCEYEEYVIGDSSPLPEGWEEFEL